MENTKKEKYQKIRGTEDWFNQYAKQWLLIRNTCERIADQYGYSLIKTPVIENKNLFVRSIGKSSDIVKKEFYDFTDKGDREIVLRPEGTAPVIRAVVENKLLENNQLPLKFYYLEPMFRYERPQSGRLRQFHQFGVECIGSNSYYFDAETILMAIECLKQLNIDNWKLTINNIGTFSSRQKWIDELKVYFNQYIEQLTPDSVERINTNPLRILDDKVDGTKIFVKNAPKIDQYLSNEEKDYFNNVCQLLKDANIEFEIDQTLVRGLDYYTNIVFEINSNNSILKGQPTIIGGGKYSKLVSELGGNDVSCIGFALGIERLAILLKHINDINKKLNGVTIALVNNSIPLKNYSFKLANLLRKKGINCFVNYDANKLKAGFKLSELKQSQYIFIIGENELKNQTVICKDQNNLAEKALTIDEIKNWK